jgi:hypothetical protein
MEMGEYVAAQRSEGNHQKKERVVYAIAINNLKRARRHARVVQMCKKEGWTADSLHG